jgi:hypothetical protein
LSGFVHLPEHDTTIFLNVHFKEASLTLGPSGFSVDALEKSF